MQAHAARELRQCTQQMDGALHKQDSHSFSFRSITPGIEVMKEAFSLPRHRHLSAYATVVLAGVLGEAGYSGRIEAKPGDVLIHPKLDCHVNQKVFAGVRLLRLPWSNPIFESGLYHVDHLDDLAVTGEKSAADASLLLGELLKKCAAKSPRVRNDWPDILAEDIVTDAAVKLGDWARDHQLAPETISRGFSLAYGVSPEVFKAESRARAAWIRITDGHDEFSAIAADTGFADQAHMNRWIRRTTGASPGTWRRRTPLGSVRVA
jgi:AraC-like DNA-binding protein